MTPIGPRQLEVDDGLQPQDSQQSPTSEQAGPTSGTSGSQSDSLHSMYLQHEASKPKEREESHSNFI